MLKNVLVILVLNFQVRHSRELSTLMVPMGSTWCCLIDGPFSNLSGDVMVLTDFIARVRSLRLIQQRNISPKLALALVRNSLVQSFGLMSSLLWARHIIVRFRDAVVRTPRRQVAADQNSVPDGIFSDPWRYAYFGPFVPGA